MLTLMLTLCVASGCEQTVIGDVEMDSSPAAVVDAMPGAGGADTGVLTDAQLSDATPQSDFCQGGDVILGDALVGGTTGTVVGGSFSAEGWSTTSVSDQIYWPLGQTVAAGSIEFLARGFHANLTGCQWGVCYYVGLFEDPSGDKLTHYDGSAFIESRYHTNNQENFHDTFKLQAGAGDGSMAEPMINPGIGWGPGEWHRFRIDWADGTSRLYIDGMQRLTAPYSTTTPIQWRHLFLGSTNYKGLGWAAIGITYRELCVRAG